MNCDIGCTSNNQSLNDELELSVEPRRMDERAASPNSDLVDFPEEEQFFFGVDEQGQREIQRLFRQFHDQEDDLSFLEGSSVDGDEDDVQIYNVTNAQQFVRSSKGPAPEEEEEEEEVAFAAVAAANFEFPTEEGISLFDLFARSRRLGSCSSSGNGGSDTDTDGSSGDEECLRVYNLHEAMRIVNAPADSPATVSNDVFQNLEEITNLIDQRMASDATTPEEHALAPILRTSLHTGKLCPTETYYSSSC